MQPLPVAQLTFTLVPTSEWQDADYDAAITKLRGLEKHLLAMGRTWMGHHLPHCAIFSENTEKPLLRGCLQEMVDALNETMSAPEGTRCVRLYEALEKAERLLKGDAP
jgi:hypothetical protein